MTFTPGRPVGSPEQDVYLSTTDPGATLPHGTPYTWHEVDSTGAHVDTWHKVAGRADLDVSQSSTFAPRPQVVWPSGLVAFWDFNEAAGSGSVSSVEGVGRFTANLFTGTHAKSVEEGPFGPALDLDGSTAFWIADADLGRLAVELSGDEITMIAWVKDEGGTDAADMGFRFGSHTEGGSYPCRQYALYFSGSMYGGSRRVSPHIGAQDGATPGYPFNKDFATSNRQVYVPGYDPAWHMEAGTYDGAQIVAYLDGLADSYTGFNEPTNTEPGGTTLTNVTKNPYAMDRGINRTSRKRAFSIGAGLTTNQAGVPQSIFNATTGLLGGIAIFNRALTAAEIMNVRLQTLMPGEPISTFDAQLLQNGALPNPVYPAKLGYQAYVGEQASYFDVSGSIVTTEWFLPWEPDEARTYPCSFRRNASTTPSLIAYAPISDMGLRLSQIRRYTATVNQALAAGATRFVVKVGGDWFAHSSQIVASVDNTDGTDWTNAETVSANVSLAAGEWYPMTVQDNAETITNLLSDSSFETGVTGYTFALANTTDTRDTARAHSGSGALKKAWTGTTAAASLIFTVMMRTPLADVTEGTSYTGSAWVNATQTQPLNIQIIWYQSDGTTVVTSTSATFTQTTPDTWQRLTVTGAAPAGAAKARVSVFVSSGGTRTDMNNGDGVWVDDVMLNAGALYDWHDGTAIESGTSSDVTIWPTANTGLQPNGTVQAVGLFNAATTEQIRITDLAIYTSPA